MERVFEDYIVSHSQFDVLYKDITLDGKLSKDILSNYNGIDLLNPILDYISRDNVDIFYNYSEIHNSLVLIIKFKEGKNSDISYFSLSLAEASIYIFDEYLRLIDYIFENHDKFATIVNLSARNIRIILINELILSKNILDSTKVVYFEELLKQIKTGYDKILWNYITFIDVQEIEDMLK